MYCRFCKTPLKHVFADLVNAPLSNAFLTEAELSEPEVYFPLKVFVCHECFLVQIDEYKKSEDIFNDKYHYFSSYSTSWLAHAKQYADEMTSRLALQKEHQVIEIASNDGYLLQYFKEKQIPVLGIEPAKNTAEVAIKKGIPTLTEYFGEKVARQLVNTGTKADLLLGNNVLAHVPDIVDFVKGLKILLAADGVITMEFPHLQQLISNNQFDTIYHEHFSYLSLFCVQRIFESMGLDIFDVEELETHGGSLRIYACHSRTKAIQSSVFLLQEKEKASGLDDIRAYKTFQVKAEQVKLEFLSFLLAQKAAGKKVAAYGAAAKGNTLLNYCGVKNDLINFVVDANPFKQGKYLPGSHIPVCSEEQLMVSHPDYVVIFPWNLKKEIIQQLNYISEWQGHFVVPIPQLQVIKA